MSWLQPRRLLAVTALTLVWCGLWGGISVANVAGGAAIAVTVTGLGLGLAGNGGVRPKPLLALTGLVLVDVVRSTISVAREVITKRILADEAIIAVQGPPGSRDHLLLLIVLITLTPGTAVVDADPDTGTLYLHLLYHRDAEATIDHVGKLADLACQALPNANPNTDTDTGAEAVP